MSDRVWIVTEADDFQGTVELVRVIGVFDEEVKARMCAEARSMSEPELAFRIQGWPMNDTIE